MRSRLTNSYPVEQLPVEPIPIRGANGMGNSVFHQFDAAICRTAAVGIVRGDR
jgi:hypothetical protein